jgi:hypothetical protein
MNSTVQKQQGIGGLFLPPHLVAYIGTFIKVHFRTNQYYSDIHTNLLLNLYKAFESIGPEADHLREYQAEVQSHLAALVVNLVILEKCDYAYGLTQREIMYVFDCYYCDPAVIMYGEETYEAIGADMHIVNTERMQHIDNEFMDCSEFTEMLAVPYMGIHFGLADDLNIKMYKYIRLLEEILRTKSTGLFAYMRAKIVISPDMLLYIYIKHNHQRYAPKWYSLASDYFLIALLNEAGVLPVVLGMAISGKREHYAGTEAALQNIVEPNLAVVKQIVPIYINPASAVLPSQVYYDDYPGDPGFVDMLTPYMYWETTYRDQVQLYVWGGPNKIIEVVGSAEIGAYLRRMK